MIQKGFRKEPEGVHFVDRAPTLKNAEIHKTSDYVLDPNLSLRDFVAKAAFISISQASEGAGGDWKSSTWEFVRLCRAHPKLMALTADEASRKIP